MDDPLLVRKWKHKTECTSVEENNTILFINSIFDIFIFMIFINVFNFIAVIIHIHIIIVILLVCSFNAFGTASSV